MLNGLDADQRYCRLFTKYRRKFMVGEFFVNRQIDYPTYPLSLSLVRCVDLSGTNNYDLPAPTAELRLSLEKQGREGML